MGYMDEYISRKLNPADLEKELLSLISRDDKEEKLIKFLRLTKNGVYAPIDDSIPYSRIEEETEETDSCQEMYCCNFA